MRTPGDRRGVKSATGRWIVTANYGAGSVGLVPIEKDGTLGPRSDLVTLPGEPGPDRKQRRRRQGLSATPRYGFNTENAPVMMNWMRRQWPMACAITERGAAICSCAGLMHNAAVLFAPVSCRAIGPNLNKEEKERDFSAFQVYH